MIPVRINGHGLHAILDTGAPASTATLDAAREAKAPLDAGGEVRMTGGVGARTLPKQVAHVDSFEVGGEQIRNTALRFGDLFGGAEQAQTGSRVARRPESLHDMLLGYDFVAAHHILISPSHHKVFFTYNGGPVFDVAPRSSAQAPAAAPPA